MKDAGSNKPKSKASPSTAKALSKDDIDDLADDSWDEGPIEPKKKKKTPKTEKPAQPVVQPTPKPAGKAKFRRRHGMLLKSFYIVVLLPMILAGAYLYFVAKDQYASHLGFLVRAEETASPVEILGGITNLSGASSGTDTDVLFEFIQSQRIVRLIDDRLDLKSMYYMPSDPIFGVDQDAKIETLQSFWSRIVKVFYDSGSGLIEVRVTAFRPEDAKAVADAIYDESSKMINDLTAIARADATRYAREELSLAVERLRETRTAIQKFRLKTQIIDPQADIVGRMGLLNSLQSQLASAQIDLDLLMQGSRADDPRLSQAQRRVDVITERLHEERQRFSSEEGTVNGAYADLIGEYESLSVDKQFAETAYLSALAALDGATAEAARKSRYLAAYIEPTLAETAQYPNRLTILATMLAFLLGIWTVAVMVYYSVRDRK
ncbi:sugar transporter [uncultured Aliiroseovarius sp.]|uniref:sugar transporter n=1 Tax=uncultured Aliiroseovarius sp. TaxID=1658783 RepID=UPI0026022556|nr:sugar transporter [uncultured Aliiroseovarius sp.]